MFFTPLRHLYNFFPVKVCAVSCVVSCVARAPESNMSPWDAHTRWQMVLVALQAICWQRCVCWGVDLGISRFPNSFVTPLLLAIFAGTHHRTRTTAHAH